MGHSGFIKTNLRRWLKINIKKAFILSLLIALMMAFISYAEFSLNNGMHTTYGNEISNSTLDENLNNHHFGGYYSENGSLESYNIKYIPLEKSTSPRQMLDSEEHPFYIYHPQVSEDNNIPIYAIPKSIFDDYADEQFGSFNQGQGDDNTPPTFIEGSIYISPKMVNIGEEVTFSAIITDDVSGIDYVYVRFSSPSGQGNKWFSSWTSEQGILHLEFESQNEIGIYDEDGLWTFESLSIGDYAGNSVWYSRSDFDNPEQYDFTVNNPSGGDFLPPEIVKDSISVSPKTANAGEKITFSVTATDDFSGVSRVGVSYKSDLYYHPHSVSWNTDQEGKLSVDVTIDITDGPGDWWEFFSLNQVSLSQELTFEEDGVWEFEYIYVQDHAGNSKYYYRRDFDDPSQFDFTVIELSGTEKKDVLPSAGVAIVDFPKSQVQIEISTAESGWLSVTRDQSNYLSLLTDMKPADIFLEIEASANLKDKPANLIIGYDHLLLPEIINESALQLYHWSGTEWSVMPEQNLIVEAKTITVNTAEFGIFGFFEPSVIASGNYDLTFEIEALGSGYTVLQYISERTAAVVIELNSSAKAGYSTKQYTPVENNKWQYCYINWWGYHHYLSPVDGYRVNWDDYYHRVKYPDISDIYGSLYELMKAQEEFAGYGLDGLSEPDLKDIAHGEGLIYYLSELEEISDQVWAARIELEPGQSGTLSIKVNGAYGKHIYALQENGELWNEVEGYQGPSDGFGFVEDPNSEYTNYRIERGNYYAGNYFEIEQSLNVSYGKVNRYIDISSPFTHGYLFEDMELIDKIDIKEAFGLMNIEPGDSAGEPTGSIQVNIEPKAARDAGAQWRLTTGPDTGWKDHGQIITGLAPGTYTITFKEISGLSSPADMGLGLKEGENVTVDGP